jgi:hypothetical protein
MRSSTSSSDHSGFKRLTASDRPGVAQPVPERDIPARPWRWIFVGAMLLAILLVAAWEWSWREYGAAPGTRNSDGLWSMQRRRIDNGEGHRTVIAGASRMLFDVDLDTWERVSGERPIQLSLEGTSPLFTVDDLAADTDFTGRLIIGVAPDVFFQGFGFRAGAVKYYRNETLANRAGQWLSMNLVEPVFAFYEPDFALITVLRRQPWPPREGLQLGTRVRKLAVTTRDRNTQMWSKVERDPEYAALAKRIWAEDFVPLDAKKQKELDEAIAKQIARAKAAVDKLKARGIDVTFVRPPSDGEYLKYEDRDFARAKTWDVLLAQTGAPGIHFQDHPELQGYQLPEWSHVAASEKPRFTENLYRILERESRKK